MALNHTILKDVEASKIIKKAIVPRRELPASLLQWTQCTNIEDMFERKIDNE